MAALYQRHVGVVDQIGLMLMKNVPDAEDTTQSVFRKMMEQMEVSPTVDMKALEPVEELKYGPMRTWAQGIKNRSITRIAAQRQILPRNQKSAGIV